MGKKKIAIIGEEESKEKQAKKEIKKTAKVPGLEGGQRVKDMSATAIIVEEPVLKPIEEETLKPKKAKPKKIRGKNWQNAKKMIDPNKLYPIEEAIKLAKKTSYSKFGGSIEAHFNVTKKGLSGEAQLPYFKSKEKKVAIVNQETLEKIKEGKIDFDVLLATPADMPSLVPYAKILGPKGLMPNPKAGTIVDDPKKAAEKFSQPKFTFKTEPDFPLIHTVIGKFNQKDEELVANFKALVSAIGQNNIKKAVVKATMGPGIKIELTPKE